MMEEVALDFKICLHITKREESPYVPLKQIPSKVCATCNSEDARKLSHFNGTNVKWCELCTKVHLAKLTIKENQDDLDYKYKKNDTEVSQRVRIWCDDECRMSRAGSKPFISQMCAEHAVSFMFRNFQLKKRLINEPLLQELGEGSRGMVFSALRNNLRIAAKIFRDPPGFEVEYRILSELKQRGYGQNHMDYLEQYEPVKFQAFTLSLCGPSLEAKLTERGLRKTHYNVQVAVAKSLLLSIEDIHKANCRHRDVKPANICYSVDMPSLTFVDFSDSELFHPETPSAICASAFLGDFRETVALVKKIFPDLVDHFDKFYEYYSIPESGSNLSFCFYDFETTFPYVFVIVNLMKKLGAGGFGFVFEATRDGVKVACKVFDDFIAFDKEFHILSTLKRRGLGNSPLDFCEQFGPVPFQIVTMTLRGPSLQTKLTERASRRTFLAVQVAMAKSLLNAMWELTSVHCRHWDVKPDNVCYELDLKSMVFIDFEAAFILETNSPSEERSSHFLSNYRGVISLIEMTSPELNTHIDQFQVYYGIPKTGEILTGCFFDFDSTFPYVELENMLNQLCSEDVESLDLAKFSAPP